ncbi:MAG: pyridoxamine 5'-phosphate oxidase family protein [Deltaproteobacteria bacterium]|nr:pyridoxamine 5'-phosphate oxidase family protein [Deltaproteobacteria bacterium]
MREVMEELIQAERQCVLATAGEEGPHASLMSYVPGPDLRSIYLVTAEGTRKFRNLLAEPRVSLLIDNRGPGRGGGDPTLALTVSGAVRPVRDPGQEEALTAAFRAEHPQLRAILEDPTRRFLEVRVLSLLLLRGAVESHYLVL